MVSLFGGAALLSLFGCATGRYVGSIGRQQTYVNRGFGVVIPLASTGLLERWRIVDPRGEQELPAADLALELRQAPLDLDADGFLAATETQRYVVPALRLYDAADDRVRMELSVQIVSQRHSDAPLDAIVSADIRDLSPAASAEDVPVSSRRVHGGFSAHILEVRTGTADVRRAVIDHAGFVGEEGIVRRQIVRVTLSASRIDERLRADHDALLDTLVLNRRSAFTSVKEAW